MSKDQATGAEGSVHVSDDSHRSGFASDGCDSGMLVRKDRYCHEFQDRVVVAYALAWVVPHGTSEAHRLAYEEDVVGLAIRLGAPVAENTLGQFLADFFGSSEVLSAAFLLRGYTDLSLHIRYRNHCIASPLKA